jgi:hypothetical protein
VLLFFNRLSFSFKEVDPVRLWGQRRKIRRLYKNKNETKTWDRKFGWHTHTKTRFLLLLNIHRHIKNLHTQQGYMSPDLIFFDRWDKGQLSQSIPHPFSLGTKCVFLCACVTQTFDLMFLFHFCFCTAVEFFFSDLKVSLGLLL